MKWYIAKLVFNITHEENRPATEFDEQFRLIRAHHTEEAFLKARFIGVKNENSFENVDGYPVNWKFIDVAFIRELDTFSDGMELYSHSHDSENPSAYVSFVQHQAENIYSKSIPHAVTLD